MFNRPYSIALRWYLDGRGWKIPFNFPFAVRIRRGSKNWHSFLVEDPTSWLLLSRYLVGEESEWYGLSLYHPKSGSIARIEQNPRKGDEILVYEEETQKWVEVGCR